METMGQLVYGAANVARTRAWWGRTRVGVVAILACVRFFLARSAVRVGDGYPGSSCGYKIVAVKVLCGGGRRGQEIAFHDSLLWWRYRGGDHVSRGDV